MALFSQIDWVIVLAVGAFLLLGKGNGAFLRKIGRYYGKAMKLKQELLSEVTRVAEIPPIDPSRPFSLKGVLMNVDLGESRRPAIPAAVSSPPMVPVPVAVAYYPAVAFSTAAFGFTSWSVARPSEGLDRGVLP
ncbi:MAG: hypothetical protein ACHQ2Y_06275 [Candidatus Lutacidiplasmatales archaeon]